MKSAGAPGQPSGGTFDIEQFSAQQNREICLNPVYREVHCCLVQYSVGQYSAENKMDLVCEVEC